MGTIDDNGMQQGEIMSFFEAGMLLCFGAAWPVNIHKSLKSRTTRGKSLPFLVILLVGYAFGIVHKLLNSRDIVLALYVINSLMVSADICIWFRNRGYDREADRKALQGGATGA